MLCFLNQVQCRRIPYGLSIWLSLSLGSQLRQRVKDASLSHYRQINYITVVMDTTSN